MTDHDKLKSIVSSSLCWLRRNKSATNWCDCARPQDCSSGMELFGDEAEAVLTALSSAGRLVGPIRRVERAPLVIEDDAPDATEAEFKGACPNCGCEEFDHRNLWTCRCPAPDATDWKARADRALRFYHNCKDNLRAAQAENEKLRAAWSPEALHELAKQASLDAAKNANTVPQLLYAPILCALQVAARAALSPPPPSSETPKMPRKRAYIKNTPITRVEIYEHFTEADKNKLTRLMNEREQHRQKMRRLTQSINNLYSGKQDNARWAKWRATWKAQSNDYELKEQSGSTTEPSSTSND